MPVYNFACPECGHTKRKYLKPGSAAAYQCGECGAQAKRVVSAPGPAGVYERLDNGFMTKSVERLVEAERIFHERVKGDPDKGK